MVVSIKEHWLDDKRLLMITRSDDDTDVAVPSGFVRMSIINFSMFEFLDDGSCKLIEFENANLNGSFPATVINMLIGNKNDYIQMAVDLDEMKRSLAA